MGYNYWNGTEAAHRRVMMKAAGYSDEDIRQKPHIGIPNSYMAGSPGTAHLRQVTEAVKEGIWAAGGIPVEFGIPATCGNVANGADEMKYEISWQCPSNLYPEYIISMQSAVWHPVI